MNLKSLSKIEDYQFYLDKAVLHSGKLVSIAKSTNKFKGLQLDRSKFAETKKIYMMCKIITSDLQHIESAFPTIDNLPIFYQELIDTVVGAVKLKKSLSSLSWLRNKVNELSRIHIKEIIRTEDITKINAIRKKFLGRVSSMFKKVSKDFIFLDQTRLKLKSFPNIKTNIKTICIAGYPNVGKSTLLSLITTARPEINFYPFTTKSIMLGYIGNKLQLIDTPGTFRDDFNKMNYIERQAFLALKYLCEKIIYVFDLSETCGYTVEDQESLFETLNRKFSDKEIIIYLSKKDLLNEDIINKFQRKYKDYSLFYDAGILKRFIKKMH